MLLSQKRGKSQYHPQRHSSIVRFVVALCLGVCSVLSNTVAQANNQLPVITSDPITVGTVGTLYTYDVEATGIPAPTFSLDIAPEGMSIDTETGVITWTPNAEGVFDVTVRASNSVFPDDTQSYSLSISGATPIITSTPILAVVAGDLYTYNVEAIGGPFITYSLDSAPIGMSIDPVSGLISWQTQTPGTFNVTVRAANGTPPDATQSFAIVVSGPAPTIISTPVTAVALGSTYTYDVNAIGSPPLTYALTTAPSGMTIDLASGIITWTPTETGNVVVTVVVSNGFLPVATQSFIIEVTGGGPTIISTPITSVALGTTYTYEVIATGSPEPTFSLSEGPQGMTIDPASGFISWIPTEAVRAVVTVVASNGFPPDATQSFTIEITGVAPAITSVPVTTVVLGATYTYDVNATGNPQQTFSLSEAPDGMDVNTTSGIITWTPITLGTFDVTVVATNGVKPDATQSFILTVTGEAPVITSIPVTSGMVGTSYTYDVNATGTPSPTYALIAAPSGMTIDPVSGVISWMPSETGSFTIGVSASNGIDPAETQSFSVTVDPEIIPPIITSTPLTKAVLNEAFTYAVHATGDPAPTYSLDAGPTGMTIDPLSGSLNWTPTIEGTFTVTVLASNGAVIAASQTFSLQVTSGFFGPTMTSTPVSIAALNEAYTYPVVAIGHPAPAYELSASPEGMAIDPVSGVISWTPTAEGNFTVTVVASNGLTPDASQTYTLNVTSGPFAPEIQTSPVTRTLVNAMYSYQADAIGNPDPSYSLISAPNGMSIDPVSGLISWAPTNSGTYEVIFTASNGVGVDAAQSYTLTVTADEFAPIITSTPVTITALNEIYTHTITATGNPAPTYSLDAPPGVNIDPVSGVLTWTPTVEGDFEVTVIASNGIIPDYRQPFTLVVTTGDFAPIITSSPLTITSVDTEYIFDVDANGVPEPTFSLDTAPVGMTIDPVSGVINWTPTTSGNFEVAVVATNGVVPDATSSFTIKVSSPVSNSDETFQVKTFHVDQNYPNPFNSSTTIEYSLPTPGHFHMAVYDVLGRNVSTLENTYRPAGKHQITWDGRDQRGSELPAGMYFVKSRMPSGDIYVMSMLKLE